MQSGSVFPPFQPGNIHTIQPAFNWPHAHLLKLTSDKFYLLKGWPKAGVVDSFAYQVTNHLPTPTAWDSSFKKEERICRFGLNSPLLLKEKVKLYYFLLFFMQNNWLMKLSLVF
jgi:hypothetical protein